MLANWPSFPQLVSPKPIFLSSWAIQARVRLLLTHMHIAIPNRVFGGFRASEHLSVWPVWLEYTHPYEAIGTCMYTESAEKGVEVPANDNSCIIWKKLQLGSKEGKFWDQTLDQRVWFCWSESLVSISQFEVVTSAVTDQAEFLLQQKMPTWGQLA